VRGIGIDEGYIPKTASERWKEIIDYYQPILQKN